jgi:hypothetical protein
MIDMKDPNCWNEWRLRYQDLTGQEHIDFYNQLAEHYPEQKSFTLSNYDYLFSILKGSAEVIEIGGWKGELADYCLKKYDIKSWKNIEICEPAIKETVCQDSRYSVENPKEFWWWHRGHDFQSDGDNDTKVLIASHFIEHLSNFDLQELISTSLLFSHLPEKYIAIESPLSWQGQSWNDYVGTHALTLGWGGVDLLMCDGMFSPMVLNDSFRIYR